MKKIRAILFAIALLSFLAPSLSFQPASAAEVERVMENLIVIKAAGTDGTYFGQYILNFYREGNLVARKRLCMTVEWDDATNMVRVISASSPERVWDTKYRWERIAQNVRPSDWGFVWRRWSQSRLWCDYLNCNDYTYELSCKVYGGWAGQFYCNYLRSP